MISLRKCGGQGRNRTADASLFRAALYQLSYLAILASQAAFVVTVQVLRNISEMRRKLFEHYMQTHAGQD